MRQVYLRRKAVCCDLACRVQSPCWESTCPGQQWQLTLPRSGRRTQSPWWQKPELLQSERLAGRGWREGREGQGE